jgi:hypothetical protein
MDDTARKRRLPALWRVLAALVLLAAGIVASTAVHRDHGVPLFLAAIGCGAVLGSWALGVLVVLAFGYWIDRGIALGFFHIDKNSGDNLGAERMLAIAGTATIGVFGILLGMGVARLVRLVVRLPGSRPGQRA